MFKRLIVVLAFPALVTMTSACDSSPTAPAPPVAGPTSTPGGSLTLKSTVPAVDGLFGGPVAVVVTGTNAQVVNGNVTIDAASGTPITLSAQGYLTYETAWVKRDKFIMYPTLGRNIPRVVEEMDFSSTAYGTPNQGLRDTARLIGPITYVLPEEMPEVDKVQWAELPGKLQPIVGYAVYVEKVAKSGSLACPVVLNPGILAPAQTTRTLSGPITNCLIELKQWGATRKTICHEGGHSVGWSHHFEQGCMGTANGWASDEYSELEVHNGRMLYQMLPGTSSMYKDLLLLAAGILPMRVASSEVATISEVGWNFNKK